MNLVLELAYFFGLDTLSGCETFPELLQAFLFIMCAVVILCVLLRSLFSVPKALNKF